MKKIAIATDSNSGLTQKVAEELGVFVLPMPFFINDRLCMEGLTIRHAEFFRLQREGAKISTSQPSPQDVLDFWDKILADYETLLYIPMSNALSSSCATAIALSQDYGGRVVVIDSTRISATQKQAVLDAKCMADRGASLEEIQKMLLDYDREAIIYITVDNLKYLREGGRITPAVASMGTLLNIKPVLLIDGGVLDVYSKCHGLKAARKKMIEAIRTDMAERFHCPDLKNLNLHAACCLATEDALAWKQTLEDTFQAPCSLDRLPLSVAAHVGFGACGVALTRKVNR
ncbi:MAG: DegV family protein [Lachnospiraceae bacterium]|nr:DegV family protein [Lachnospiraceae bacterium]